MYGEGELKTVSESWLKPLDLSTTDDPNISSAMDNNEHFCKLVLYKEIQDSQVRIWDVVILVPNLLFLLFMIARCNRARLKLRATSSPIYLAFYGLVICNIVISVTRCIVSMSVNAASSVGGTVDKVMWVTVRFFLLATEMSVVIFSLAFGNLDSQSSIRRVLIATALIALVFTITQGTLELVLPDDTFHIPSRDFYVFGHGGMKFWFCSSLVFTSIYMFILILPRTRLRDRLTLPNKKSFYVYVGALATLNLVQSIGAGLLNYTQDPAGLCVVDLTAAVYLTLFTPLVYRTFLSEVFGVSQPSIQFSYKAQVDDAMDEDTVSLPHQQSFSSLRTDSDYIYQVHTPFIHMPLYQSLITIPPASKQKTSIYSPTSRKDEKTASTSRSSSQHTLYRTSPDAKTLLSRRRNTLMSTPDLAKNPMSDNENFIEAQKSTPDLSSTRRAWGSENSSPTKYHATAAASGSISNLVLGQSTASNFIYRPPENDSSANLFSDPGKISTNAIVHHAIQESFEQSVARISASSDLEQGAGPSWSVLPPLESSLENILNSDSHDTSNVGKTDSTRDSKNFIELSSTKHANAADLGNSSSDVNVETSIGSATSSHDNPRLSRDSESSAKAKESSGLGDYLQSLKSPKYQSPPKKPKRESDPQNPGSPK